MGEKKKGISDKAKIGIAILAIMGLIYYGWYMYLIYDSITYSYDDTIDGAFEKLGFEYYWDFEQVFDEQKFKGCRVQLYSFKPGLEEKAKIDTWKDLPTTEDILWDAGHSVVYEDLQNLTDGKYKYINKDSCDSYSTDYILALYDNTQNTGYVLIVN